jgi:hypothetical protein
MKTIVKKTAKLLRLKPFISWLNRDSAPSFWHDLDKNLRYEFEKDANEIIRIVRKHTMLPYINLLTLYEQVLFCETNAIRGDYVECGVWKGGLLV